MRLEDLLRNQPWRSRIGQPRNALDPTWGGEPIDDCPGDLEWDGAPGGWWGCSRCGAIGKGHYTKHKPPHLPEDFLSASKKLFIERMRACGMGERDAEVNAAYIQAVALRQAAGVKPDQLLELLRRLETP